MILRGPHWVTLANLINSPNGKLTGGMFVNIIRKIRKEIVILNKEEANVINPIKDDQ